MSNIFDNKIVLYINFVQVVKQNKQELQWSIKIIKICLKLH